MKRIVLGLLIVWGAAACAAPRAEVTPLPTVTLSEPSPVEQGVMAEGRVVPARETTLAFSAYGTVAEVYVKAGDRVRAGDVLARLGGPNDAAYAAAQAELVAVQQALDALRRSADLARAQAWIALRQAEEEYEKAENWYEELQEGEYTYPVIRYVKIGPRRVPTIKMVKVKEPDAETLEDARANMELKKALYEEAQRAYERVKDGPDAEQLALLEARLKAAQASVDAFTLIAPFDGTVMDVNIAVGDQVGPERWAFRLADTDTWYVETTDLNELEVVQVRVGMRATVVADALPNVPMRGVVESIGQTFYVQGGDILYRVKIRLEEKDPRVLWGMTVEVTFEEEE